jgi:hypothetical protein
MCLLLGEGSKGLEVASLRKQFEPSEVHIVLRKSMEIYLVLSTSPKNQAISFVSSMRSMWKNVRRQD